MADSKTFKKNEIDFTEGSYLGKIIRFALPVLGTGVLQILFNAVDSMVVGRFVGDAALAAVTSNGPLINLIVGLFLGVSVGSNVLVAQFYGAKRSDDVSETVHSSVLLAAILGVFVMTAGLLFSRYMLELMNSPEDVIGLADIYLKVYFIGTPVLLLYNFSAAMLRAVGDTKHPFIFLAIGGVLNVLLNLFFVVVLDLSTEMRVAGVAIGTVVSELVSAVLVIVHLMRSNGPLKLDLRKLKLHGAKVKKILLIGIPAGVQSVMFSVSNAIIQTALNGFGKAVLAGNGAANQIEGFTYMAMQSVFHAALNFVSQNVGAKRFDRLKKGVFICLGMVFVTGLVLGYGSYLLGEPLLLLYTDSEEAIRVGMLKLAFVCSIYCVFGVQETLSSMERGLGASIVPMIITILGCCVFRIIWIATVFRSHQTIETLYLVYPVSWGVTTVAHATAFFILWKRVRSDLSGHSRKLLHLPKIHRDSKAAPAAEKESK